MKNIRIYALCAIFVLLCACRKERLSEMSVVDTQWGQLLENELDKRLKDRFSFEDYNIEILYRWDKNKIPEGTVAYPPKTEKIEAVMETVEQLFIKTFTDSKNIPENFLKESGIIRFILLGGDSTKDGVLLSIREEGTASNEIFIYGVNDFDIRSKDKIYKLLYSLYHQFAIRISHAIPYDREAFAALSKDVYGALQLKADESQLYKRMGLTRYANEYGFYTLHSMKNPDDDFAQVVTALLLYTPVEIAEAEQRAIESIEDSFEAIKRAKEAQARLIAKREFVQRYFKETLNINIRKLQLVNLKNIDDFIKEHR